jgi:hypothetical protein
MIMKHNIKFLLAFSLVASIFLGCTKHDGSTPLDIESVPAINVVKKSGNAAIDMVTLKDFNATYTVSLLYPGNIQPEKIDVVIRKNGDNSNVKVLAAGITSFPSDLTVDSAKLEAAFDSVILGDNYDISADIYYNGKKYEAYPNIVVGIDTITGQKTYAQGWGAGLTTQGSAGGSSTASPSIRYSAICAYDPDIYEGTFIVDIDDWEDYAPGDEVEITKIDDTHFSFDYPTDIRHKPIIVTVDPLTNVTSVAEQIFGSYTGAPYDYGVVSVANPDNVVAPCEESFGVTMQFRAYTPGTTTYLGGFGNGFIKMHKKP